MPPLHAGRHTFQRVSTFKYLGVQITESNDTLAEVRARKRCGMKAYFACKKSMRSKRSSIATKMAIYKMVILPTVLYACATWNLKKGSSMALTAFDNLMARRMVGAVYNAEKDRYVLRSVEEARALTDHHPILPRVRRALLKWAGHLARGSATAGAGLGALVPWCLGAAPRTPGCAK